MVAQLNNDAFAHVLGTLDFGLRHQVYSHDLTLLLSFILDTVCLKIIAKLLPSFLPMVQDTEVVGMCLKVLKALASYHYKETSSGQIGLGSHASGFKDSDGRFQEGILSRFLRSLLQLLLFEDYR